MASTKANGDLGAFVRERTLAADVALARLFLQIVLALNGVLFLATPYIIRPQYQDAPGRTGCSGSTWTTTRPSWSSSAQHNFSPSP